MRILIFAIIGLLFIGILITNTKDVDETSQIEENLIPKDELLCPNCNVLVIGFDALQGNHVGHLGYERDTTPTLDSLAETGVTFAQNYVVAPWTVPSFMSYFTSLYPSEHKVTNKFVTFTEEEKIIANLAELSPTVRTLAEAFKAAGYDTGGFTGDAGVHSNFGYAQGFDVYTDEQPFGSMDRSREHALKWLDDRDNTKPFFMFFHGYDAHGQFSELTEGYASRFGESGKYEITKEKQRDLREKGLAEGEFFMEGEEVTDWNSWYDSKIYDADQRIKKMLDELESRGLTDNLLVVVISDHGTEIHDHRRFDHGYSLYNELIRVPMIFSMPGRELGAQINTQVRSIDMLPTIFEMVGIEKDAVWQEQIRGKSLIPVITGEDIRNREVFSATDYRNYTHKRSLIDGDGWKLIMSLEDENVELYNINDDYSERRDKSMEEPEKVSELREKLLQYMDFVGESLDDEWPIGCLPVYNDQCVSS